MLLPTLKETSTKRLVTSKFGGYDHRLRIEDGQWWDMKNLTSDHWPMLASRPARGIGEAIPSPGGLTAKDCLIWVSGGSVVVNGKTVDLQLTEDGPKQLVSMGAFLVIWPDKKYLNTGDLTDFGPLEADYQAGEDAEVLFRLCDAEGTEYQNIQTQQPETPQTGDLWMGDHQLKKYDAATGAWTAVPDVYVKILCADIGQAFGAWDGVELSGIAYSGDSETLTAQYAQLNATKVITAKGDDYLVVVGIVDRNASQTGGLRVRRRVPDMDYVCQAQNRLWGCKYGVVGGKPVNELYCCKLGDFKNWNCFMGISTDSWAASVGSDGAFTGAITYQGYPTFFKENRMHRIAVSTSGAHQVTDTAARGVQKGSWRSLCVVNEVLYYKGRTEVCAYDGSVPCAISAQLGDARYSEAVGGGAGGKYYVSMREGAGAYSLFVYDTARGMWHREDDFRPLMFAACDDDLFAIEEGTGKLVALYGTQGTAEDSVEWEAVTGILAYEYPDRKYLGRMDLRVQLQGELTLYVRYDSGGPWERLSRVCWQRGTTRTFAVPVIPRRCDHFQLKLAGRGEMRLFSLAKILEMGSDL